MSLSSIWEEFEANGRLSQRSIHALREALHSANPYEAITVATDCGERELIPDILPCLDSPDPMVRWNAIASLYTRFRVPERLDTLLRLATEDEDTGVVRAIAITGIGETLPKVKDPHMRRKMAELLMSTFENSSLYEELRAAAYEGILAAVDVLPLDRPPANKPLDFSKIDKKKLEEFREQYL
jgi:HEAT repeat protein